MTRAYALLKQCPVCGMCTRKVAKHIKDWHPSALDGITFQITNKRADLLRPTLAREADSQPKLMVEVKRRN